MLRNRLTLVAFLTMFVANSWAQQNDDLASILKKSLSGLQSIKTLEFRSEFGVPDEKRFTSILWKYSVDGLYTVDFVHNVSSPIPEQKIAQIRSLWSYDGTQYYQWSPDDGQLDISKKAFPRMGSALDGRYDLFLPYSFLKTTNNALLLKDFSDPQVIASAIGRMKLVSIDKSDVGKIIKLAFENCYDSNLDIPCTIIVTFDESLNYFPISWEASNEAGEVFKKVKVEKVNVVDQGQNKFAFASVVKISRNIYKGTMEGPRPFPFFESLLALKDVQIDKLDSSDFIFDPSAANVIRDCETNTFIRVPR